MWLKTLYPHQPLDEAGKQHREACRRCLYSSVHGGWPSNRKYTESQSVKGYVPLFE